MYLLSTHSVLFIIIGIVVHCLYYVKGNTTPITPTTPCPPGTSGPRYEVISSGSCKTVLQMKDCKNLAMPINTHLIRVVIKYFMMHYITLV